jgi:hypothetical protein
VGEVEAFLAVRSIRAGHARDNRTVAARAIVLRLQHARVLSGCNVREFYRVAARCRSALHSLM